MQTLYPDIEPYRTHHIEMEPLQNGSRHRIYVEECGNPDGIPVVFLHGGPGSGCRPQHRCYFDPQRYRIVLFDQRGCGRSEPCGELGNNTTDFLLSDMETIRRALDIDKWMLFGGSWGATLALCYAREHPRRVLAMILRGVFLGRQQDIDWVYAEGGASRLFPDAWQQLVAELPATQQARPLPHYFERLQTDDAAVQLAAATTLNNWEATIVMLRDHEFHPVPEQGPGPLAHSLVQLHYALNGCFIAQRPLLDDTRPLRAIPARIVHGRYDIVCPLAQSWALKQVWPEAELEILPLAGHAAGEPAIIDALVRATDDFAGRLS